MKKLIIIFFVVLSIAKEISIINPTWSIIDSVGNYELIEKGYYNKYLEIIKETDKIINLNPEVDSSIYNRVFKSGIWDKMILHLEKIYEKSKNPLIKEIIKYMKDIKKKVKEKKIAIV